MLNCPNCNEKFTEVYMFPCMHNFCGKCTNLMKKGTDITCLTCSKKCHQDNIKRNTFIEKMSSIEPPNKKSKVEMSISSNKDLEKIKDKIIICEICDPDETTTKASKYCTDCHQFMCEKCSKMHIRSKISNTHLVIDKIDQKPSSSKKSKPICKKHKKALTLYCKKCDILICSTCDNTNHSDHDTSDDLDEVFEKSNSDVKNKISEIDDIINNQNRLIKDNKLLKILWLQQCDTIGNEMNSYAKELKDLIDSANKANVYKLNEIKIDFLKSIQENLNEITCYTSSLTNVKAYFEELINRGSNVDVFNSKNFLNKYDWIETDKPELVSNTEISYKKPSIGKWIVSELTESLKFDESKDLSIIDLTNPINSICVFKRNIYTVDRYLIIIYDIKTKEYNSHFSCSKHLRDNNSEIFILSTLDNFFLYYQFKPNNHTCILKSNDKNTFFELKLFERCAKITSTFQQTLLVLIERHVFIELSVNGDELKKISIPQSCYSNQFSNSNIVFELKNGQYVITKYNGTNSVAVILLGKEIKSFGKSSIGGIIICTDGEKYIFVLESDLGKITVLSTEMEPVHEFSNKEFKNMYYDQGNDKLVLFNEKKVFYGTYYLGEPFFIDVPPVMI